MGSDIYCLATLRVVEVTRLTDQIDNVIYIFFNITFVYYKHIFDVTTRCVGYKIEEKDAI